MTESAVAGWQDYVPQVREYLAYCKQSRAELEAQGHGLDRKHHPTADGAVKMIPHGGDRTAADAIRQAFGELTGSDGQP
jgi:hypothetical protein